MLRKYNIQELISNPFFLLSIITLIGGLSYFVLGYDRIDMNLYFYCHRNSFLDYFFFYATKLAETIVTLVILLCLFYYRNAYLLFYLLLIIVVTLVVYFLKHQVFGYIRPALYLQGHLEVSSVMNMPLLQNYSFPSGHTTFIFATMFYLSLIVKNTNASYFFFFLALMCAISRVYLFQHFYIDIYAGAILGILITSILYILTKKTMLENPNTFLSFSLKKYISVK